MIRTIVGSLLLVGGVISAALWSELAVAIVGRQALMRAAFTRGDDTVAVTKWSIIGGGSLLGIVGLLLLIFGVIALSRKSKPVSGGEQSET
jgi:hypothetical protein